MNEKIIFRLLQDALMELNQEKVLNLARQAILNNVNPNLIIDSLADALKDIGEKYSRGEAFIPELIFCGEIFTQAMEILRPEMKKDKRGRELGRIVIGTVKGDLHDLGIKVVSLVLTMGGFEVVNLGKDVPTETFIAKTKETKPEILGLSALLTTTLTQQKEVIEALKTSHLRDRVKVMIGGAPVTQEWADTIGADAVGFDAMDSLKKAKELMEKGGVRI